MQWCGKKHFLKLFFASFKTSSTLTFSCMHFKIGHSYIEGRIAIGFNSYKCTTNENLCESATREVTCRKKPLLVWSAKNKATKKLSKMHEDIFKSVQANIFFEILGALPKYLVFSISKSLSENYTREMI